MLPFLGAIFGDYNSDSVGSGGGIVGRILGGAVSAVEGLFNQVADIFSGSAGSLFNQGMTSDIAYRAKWLFDNSPAGEDWHLHFKKDSWQDVFENFVNDFNDTGFPDWFPVGVGANAPQGYKLRTKTNWIQQFFNEASWNSVVEKLNTSAYKSFNPWGDYTRFRWNVLFGHSGNPFPLPRGNGSQGSGGVVGAGGSSSGVSVGAGGGAVGGSVGVKAVPVAVSVLVSVVGLVLSFRN